MSAFGLRCKNSKCPLIDGSNLIRIEGGIYMTANFSAELNSVKRYCLELEQVEKSLINMMNSISSVYNNLSLSGKGTSNIKKILKEQIDHIKELSRKMHDMKEILEDVIRCYSITEAKLSGDLEGLKVLGEYLEDYFSDIFYDAANQWKDWKDSYKERKENVVGRISDKDTREGFSEDYKDVLQQIYEDVPQEYEDARNLYDKYSRDVVVADFNTVDEKGKASPYHSGGELHLNTNADLSNPRGDGTTYYHEYGHFIVYKEGWVDGANCKDEFLEFETSLRDEVSAYIDAYEQTYKQEGIELGYSGSKLEKYIEDQTKAAINADINGPSKEYYDINNGLSDIIDSVSNGKYQPSYGHPDGYWDANPSRVANEAFAQFFSAQMTGDTTEIENMKEIMPETYDIYI